MALAVLLLACWGSDEPLVRAVDAPVVTPAQIEAKREAEELRSTPRIMEVNYKKPEGVYIDVQFMGGRKVDNIRDIIADQLGSLAEQSEPVDGKQTLVFERGELKTVDGTIMVIDVPLPEPVRRTEALVLAGFSPRVDKYLAFTKEFRVVQWQDFRRIVLYRVAPNAEEVNRISADKRQEGPSGRGLLQ